MSMMIMIGHSSGANFRENVWGHGKGKKGKLGYPHGTYHYIFCQCHLEK